MSLCAKICGFELEKFEKKFSFGGIREGFYIHLKDTLGNNSCGEVAPLPGRSLETLDQAYNNLITLRENFLNGDLKPFALHPSVMFGMQMALFDLQNSQPKFNGEITKLYTSPPVLPSNGPVKLKLGNETTERAIEFFSKFKRKKKNIVIDLERKWSLEKTLCFCKEIDTSSILYIEDPVTNYSDLEIFNKKTNVYFAIDNFLSFQPIERIKLLKGLHSIIVKPSLLGGLHECKQLQQAFYPVPIVLSSLFETKIGISHIKTISSILCPGKPAGVDTLKFLI